MAVLLEWKNRFGNSVMSNKTTEQLEQEIASLQKQLLEERELRQSAEHELAYIRDELSKQHKDITDSIDYAKKIQTAILPPFHLIKQQLPKSFILYLPKDVVSGDFYFVDEEKGHIVFAAVDCTGHGVPGALMSVVGFEYIHQAVKEKGMTKPAEILSYLDWGVNNKLRQTVDPDTIRDGMDLGLCSIDFENGKLQYAGAYNSMYLVSKQEKLPGDRANARPAMASTDGMHYLHEVRPDKIPIGGDGIVDEFTNNEFDVEEGDIIYLFSDGFADQFGGPRGKKYKYNKLKQYLLSIKDNTMPEQLELLANEFSNWKGDLEQIDDVCIIGVRV